MLRPPDYASSSVQIRNARSPPPVAPPVAPEGLMPTDPAGLVSQLEGARGTKLDPVILVRVRGMVACSSLNSPPTPETRARTATSKSRRSEFKPETFDRQPMIAGGF